MTVLIALALLHVVGALVWAAAAAVLGLILIVARRNEDSTLRALPEVVVLSCQVLRPAIVVTSVSGIVLAILAGLATEAWVLISALLALAALAADAAVIGPECRRAQEMPRAAALARGRHALLLAGLSLGGQAGAIALVVLTPSWSGIAILAGLVACLVLAAALVSETEAGRSTPA